MGDLEESCDLRQRSTDSDNPRRPRLSKHGTIRDIPGDDAIHYPADDNHRFFERVNLLWFDFGIQFRNSFIFSDDARHFLSSGKRFGECTCQP